MQYRCLSHGKWILSGEHAVLRGGYALAFPLLSRQMEFVFERTTEAFQLVVDGEQRDLLQAFIPQLWHHGLTLIRRKPEEGFGVLKVTNRIPVGTGLGASAALSVCIARLFCHFGWISDGQIFTMARDLENVAHGKSSGLDIATVMSSEGIYFSRDKDRTVFHPRWQPELYLCYSGQQGLTSQCISQVENILRSNADLGMKIDQEMRQSVELCRQALTQSLTMREGLPILKKGIELAESCFDSWGLQNADLRGRADWLREHGAIAVKPVGSGGGGYLLGLWAETPSPTTLERLIPCFSKVGAS